MYQRKLQTFLRSIIKTEPEKSFKQEEFRFQKEIERNLFSNRVFDEWNGLSNHNVSARTMKSFKRRLDKFMGEDDR